VAAAQRIYARALFEAAESAKRVDAVDADLGAFVEALDGSAELQAFLDNPQVESRAKADVLAQLTQGADELVTNTLRLLAEKGRADEVAHVYAEFRALVDRSRRRIAVELTTAHELSDAEAKAIVQQIEKASGRKVEATRTVDPDLIGGIVLQVGSHRLDASVRGRLDRLRRQLVTA
jgi:F-type H+-transporting ATPase subunit delta